MLSLEERLRIAKNNVDGMNRLQAAQGHVIVAGANVVIPNKEERKQVAEAPADVFQATEANDEEDIPIGLLLVSEGPQDDDIRLTIDGVPIFDTQLIVSGYIGSLTVGNRNNPDFLTTGFRKAAVTRDQAIAAGANWALGATVKVDVFDGWGPGVRTAPWNVIIDFRSGRFTQKTGGTSSSGTSRSFTPDPVPSDYYDTGPHFFDYHENGSFELN